MSDYSSYSMSELYTVYKFVSFAYNNLICPAGVECESCGVSADCKKIEQVKNNIQTEILRRKPEVPCCGEEKENRP